MRRRLRPVHRARHFFRTKEFLNEQGEAVPVQFGRMDTERALAVHNMPGMGEPLAPWVAAVGAFKREVALPVFHAARLADVASARHAVREGLLDMAGMTPAHIADPHLV